MPNIVFPPGVVSTRSLKTNTANWREANLMRWDDITLKPVGGWAKVNYPDGSFASRVREMHKWFDNNGTLYTAYLCEQHCYVDKGGVLINITPADGLAPPPTPDAGGFGDAEYDLDEYGTPRDVQFRLDAAAPCYTLDNWGQELRVMTSSDGRLLGWDPAAADGTLLTAVANAPVSNRTFVVTPERFIILFGAGGDMSRFSWSDQENDTVWNVDIATKAGGYNVEPRAPILGARLWAGGVLMFTARAAYLISYTGLPYIYSYEKSSECPAPFSAASVVETPAGLMWAAPNGFWVHNGVNASPLSCSIWDWIKDQIDFARSRFEAYMINVPAKFEIWWFFVRKDDATFNTRVAIYNYKNSNWTMGKMSRTCGVSATNDQYPLMSDGAKIYQHEDGFEYSGAPEKPWVESFTINMQGGAIMNSIYQMLPELVGDPADIQFSFVMVDNPTKETVQRVAGPMKIKDNGYVDVRVKARDIRMRVEMIGRKDWSLGPINMDTRAGGNK